MTIVTLLTDFGTADSYVAEMKGVLSTYAPSAKLVDITHEVSPGDVRAAQYILSRTWMFFPEGTIYVAVVDAGVGTDRRVLGATRFGRYFLAPDNGLLSFLSMNATFISIPVLPEATPTFHGRDVFAPAAGVLANGGSLSRWARQLPIRSSCRCRSRPRTETPSWVKWCTSIGSGR